MYVHMSVRVREHTHVTPVSIYFHNTHGCIYVQVSANTNVRSIFAHAILPAFMGEKLFNVGNAVKRN